MLSHAPAGLHAGLIERARPRRPTVQETFRLVRPTVLAPPVEQATPRQRFALTVRVEPNLLHMLRAEKARRGTTQQAILHRALEAWLRR